jgi:acyl-CoA reductase-like NAD-dependent aldehyde dehydrogenase
MVENPLVRRINFTGSTATGRELVVNLELAEEIERKVLEKAFAAVAKPAKAAVPAEAVLED